MSNPLLDSSELAKLKWRCRRGMLENDLFLQRFFERFEGLLTKQHETVLYALMTLSDNDLMDLFLSRKSVDELGISGLWLNNETVTREAVDALLLKLKQKGTDK